MNINITKQQWTIIGVVVAIIAVWYFFLRKKKTETGYYAVMGTDGGETGYAADWLTNGRPNFETGYAGQGTGLLEMPESGYKMPGRSVGMDECCCDGHCLKKGPECCGGNTTMAKMAAKGASRVAPITTGISGTGKVSNIGIAGGAGAGNVGGTMSASGGYFGKPNCPSGRCATFDWLGGWYCGPCGSSSNT